MTGRPTPRERTPDGRYLVVDGRKWRAADPNVPDPFTKELVRELMAARRAVRDARGDPSATAAARRRVQDAKVALGERGRPWWEEQTPADHEMRLAAAIRALLRARGEGKSICPSDAARIAGSPDWRPLMDTARTVGKALAARGEIEITSRGRPVDGRARATGPLRYRAGPHLDG